MKNKTWDWLNEKDPARAALAQRMLTYLNHLEGSVDRGDLKQFSGTLHNEEAAIGARLSLLEDIR